MHDRESDSTQPLLHSILILRGAISVYEKTMPEICRTLIAAQKDTLYYSMDLLAEALYRLHDDLEAEWLALRKA